MKNDYDFDTNFLKTHKNALICPITHLINLSVKHAVVSAVWKVAKIHPILKSGYTTRVNNYTPISILPIFSKIIEKWVAQQLNDHLNNGHNFLHPMQFGFCGFHSTESNNFIC